MQLLWARRGIGMATPKYLVDTIVAVYIMFELVRVYTSINCVYIA